MPSGIGAAGLGARPVAPHPRSSSPSWRAWRAAAASLAFRPHDCDRRPSADGPAGGRAPGARAEAVRAGPVLSRPHARPSPRPAGAPQGLHQLGCAQQAGDRCGFSRQGACPPLRAVACRAARHPGAARQRLRHLPEVRRTALHRSLPRHRHGSPPALPQLQHRARLLPRRSGTAAGGRGVSEGGAARAEAHVPEKWEPVFR